MNPPFSASPHVEGRFAEAAMRHVARRLRVSPKAAAWSRSPATMSVPISRPGATASCVCRKNPASSSRRRSPARPMSATVRAWRRGSPSSTAFRPKTRAPFRHRPEKLPMPPSCSIRFAVWCRRGCRLPPSLPSPPRPRSHRAQRSPCGRKLLRRSWLSSNARRRCRTSSRFRTRPATGRPDSSVHLTASLYESYALQAIHIPGAQPHPTKLVQSAAMAAVAPPRPSYRPHLPPRLLSSWHFVGCAAVRA